MQTEPIRISAAVEALLLAVFPVLLVFNVIQLDQTQIAIVVAAIVAVVKFVGAIITRRLVWAPDSVTSHTDAAVNTALYPTGEPTIEPS